MVGGNLSFNRDGFRQARWGMSSPEVRASERATLVREDHDRLIYDDWLFGRPCLVTYSFEGNTLVWGSYIFGPDQRETAHMVHFNLTHMLTEKYGAPEDTSQRVIVGGFQGIAEESAGVRLLYWQASESTDLELSLVERADGVLTVISYRSQGFLLRRAVQQLHRKRDRDLL